MSHVDDGTLHAYLDGELSPAEAQGIAAHVAQCPGCRERLDVERALIARTGELLGLAAPPDRDLPPFRAGDVKRPTRLWWHVRLPLAWAATVVLALGIGAYLGSGSAAYLGRPAPMPPTASVAPEQARSRSLAAPETVARVSRQRAQAEVRIAKRAAAPPPPAVAAPSAMPQAPAVDRIALRDAAEQPRQGALVAAFSLDSARAVLGRDPIVLPGAPIRAVRRDRQSGYAAVVVIEQQLDAGTVIELVERRQAATNLDAVVATAAEGRAVPDSLAAHERARVEAPAAKVSGQIGTVEKQTRPVRRIGGLEVQISGPLGTDSLQKLLQLVRPLQR